MPLECYQGTSGGKGNMGMFIEHDPNICAAGVPTLQASETVGDALQHYLLKDEVDSLICDAEIPASKPRPLPRLRKPMPQDMRHSCGSFGQVPQLINPPTKTKFQTLVDDFKETCYKSYWKTRLGKVPDAVPMLPEGLDVIGTTFGRANPRDSLYDIVMPKIPHPDNTPPSKEAGVQINRNYCSPPFDPNLTYGYRTYVEKQGQKARCCVTEDRLVLGKGGMTTVSSLHSNFLEVTKPRLCAVLAPNDNIKKVPEGYSFGKLKPPDNLPECLTTCELNKGVQSLRESLKHLNTLRRALRTRFLPNFFDHFYLDLKYYDTEKTGWLLKELVYKQCGLRLIRFDPILIEPLLSMWDAFDGSRIEYKMFVRVINYRIPSPEIPKIQDVRPECLEFQTTYREMVKPGQAPDLSKMAGLPGGRYFDKDYPITPLGCCKATRICLPQETDMKSCINPSTLTQLFVSHRDMFAKREPSVVRRAFEAAYGKFSDERFHTIWEEATKLHSQGWVCYQTFREALTELEKKAD